LGHASIAGRPKFLIDPLLIAVAKTHDAEAARFGDRLCQCSTGCSSHRDKKTRVLMPSFSVSFVRSGIEFVLPFRRLRSATRASGVRRHRKGHKLIRAVLGANPTISNKLLAVSSNIPMTLASKRETRAFSGLGALNARSLPCPGQLGAAGLCSALALC
jgi:hypothetical protein